MNHDRLTHIRASIGATIEDLRTELPEAALTALQAHLDALLKEELRALTGQALMADFTDKFAAYIDPRKDPEPTPWYPDDSGDWVEGHPRDLPPDTPVFAWLYVKERNGKYYRPSPEPMRARDLSVVTEIVAYKVVKP